jgi:hypothetical protein
MSIGVHVTDCKVLVVIECKDTIEAQRVGAELSTDVNSGKFNPIGDKEEPSSRYAKHEAPVPETDPLGFPKT